MIVMPAADREAVLARVRDFLATCAATSDGEFVLPMRTCVLRSRKAAVSA
jgi:hypothetical protein